MRGVMRRPAPRKDEGFVLIWALLLMVVLLMLGVSGIGTSIFESQMTANDALHKQSFFQADGGSGVAVMLIEENVSCPVGFTANNGSNTLILGNVLVYKKPDPRKIDRYRNDATQAGVPSENPASPLYRDAYYFFGATDGTRTNIKTGGTRIILAGGSRNMGSGYEGLPKNQASATNYDTYSQYLNVRQSQSIVEILWQHINGLEGTCNY